MGREAFIHRKTLETDISLRLNIDGSGVFKGSSGIGFLDHLLAQLVKHGLLDLELEVQGDLQVDAHHTVEDLGLCLGQALDRALGDKAGIVRYGSAWVPMDEVLVQVVLDLSGRPFLASRLKFKEERLGSLDSCLIGEFLRALANAGGITLHVRQLRGGNGHHLAEACFKALGRALRQAVSLDPRVQGVPSTKGSLG
ncbi:MAG: imidazoleglycerol-phosphate dehydratase [Clostridia bacterium]|nr:imidazoleglycerol-phosphate dehydratase [Clostridia bacterium]